MPPFSSRLLGVARCTLSEGSLRAEAPIGWSRAAGRCRRFNADRRQSSSTTKRPESKSYTGNARWLGGVRFAAAWKRAKVASIPKRSDAKPLLGAIFGASALAYLGSSIISRVDTEDVEIEDESTVTAVESLGEFNGVLLRVNTSSTTNL